MRRFPSQIEEWIPHRGRMKLVERVVDVDEERCVTEAVVSEAWPTYDPGRGGVSAVVLVDLVAQSAAAFSSWEHQADEAPGQGGFIVGVRKARWSAATLPPGATLRTTVRTEARIENYASFIGEVTAEGGFEARVELQAFRPEAGE